MSPAFRRGFWSVFKYWPYAIFVGWGIGLAIKGDIVPAFMRELLG